MASISAIIVGTSHTRALLVAAQRVARTDIMILNPRQNTDWESRMKEVDPTVAPFSMFGGNYHNIMGLLEHPVPFDFIVPWREQTELEPRRTLVPYHILSEAFQQNLKKQVIEPTKKLRERFSSPLYYVLAPPPISSNEYIATHPDSAFRELMHKGVAPPLVRLKLYELYCKVSEELFANEGVTLLRPPAHAVDENGFLKEDYWRGDATHANIHYGELVLSQIDTLLRKTDDESL